MTNIELDPFDLGWKDAAENKPEEENPFKDIPTGHPDHWKYCEWQRGWFHFILCH